ncbi:MAG: tyrosine-type recombinase/integrase [Lachnospiraceae bacterium]|nr:tyrosine-type recombinase/integrase [Lachnospiraceae bacterium]
MKRYIDSFIEYMIIIRKASRNTTDAYRRDLAQFAEYMNRHGITAPDEVTEEAITDYCFELTNSGLASASLSRKISVLKTFFRFLVENDDIPRNLTDVIEQPGLKHSRPRILRTDEIDRIIDSVDNAKPMGKRDKALLELMYSAGLKVGEIIKLMPEDVDLRSSVVSIDHPENGSDRKIPFGEKAREALVDWIVMGREKYVEALDVAPVFVNTRGTGLTRQSVWKIVRHYAGEAGIRGEVTPGMLRHSFAAHLMENGADADSLARMLGFSTRAQTIIYESDEKTRLRDVYSAAWKRG